MHWIKSESLNISNKSFDTMGSTYFSKRIPERTAVRRPSKRTKTFKTEEAAKAWAEKKGIKNYELVNIKSAESKIKKIKVVAK